MKKGYRIVVNNDVVKIITKDKTIKLTLLDREGGDTASEIFLEVYTPKRREGYDIPQYVEEPDYHEIVDVFYFDDIMIWGVKERILVEVDNSEEPEYQEEVEVHWYFDKGEL